MNKVSNFKDKISPVLVSDIGTVVLCSGQRFCQFLCVA
jgi:hypothetical protein